MAPSAANRSAIALPSPRLAPGHERDLPFTCQRPWSRYYAHGRGQLDLTPERPARAARRRRRRTADRRSVEPDLLRRRSAIAASSSRSRRRPGAGPQSRRAAAGSADPRAPRHRGAGARGALGGRRRPPDVPPLFVMSFVDGASLEPLFDLDGEDAEPVVAERMRNAARALAALHALDPAAIGLGAEPVVGPDAEIDRWCRLLETVDPVLAPGWDEVAGLRAREPAPTAAIVHGDFRLGNLLAPVRRHRGHRLGDLDRRRPRVDVGWFLANADPETYQRPTRYAGRLPRPRAARATPKPSAATSTTSSGSRRWRASSRPRRGR